MLIVGVCLLGEPVQAMATSNEHQLGGIPIGNWGAGIHAAAGCAPRPVRNGSAGAQVLVVSPSVVMRLALVQRLSHIDRPRLCITLSETVPVVEAEMYDLVVMCPYLSRAERARATELQARHPRTGLIEFHDSPQEGGIIVVCPGLDALGLTEIVYAALLTSFPDTSTGGTDA
jgi:hypothetical protein